MTEFEATNCLCKCVKKMDWLTSQFTDYAECPPAEDGMERFACPTQDLMGRYRCIDDHVLCDGFYDCPGAEDEDKQACMFYKTVITDLPIQLF